MYCCSELLKVTRLIFNTNGYYKRVEFAVCQNCGTPHTLVYTMRKDGKDKEKFFKGKTAVNEFKRYEKRKNFCRQGSFSNQNVFYGDFLKTRKKDIKGNTIYEQTRKNFNGQYEILNTIHTNYSTM